MDDLQRSEYPAMLVSSANGTRVTTHGRPNVC